MRKFFISNKFLLTIFVLFFTITSCMEKEKKALELKVEGINLIYKSKFDDALETLNKSLKYNDKDPETYFYIGAAYFNKNDANKAFDYYSKSIEVDSTFAQAYINRGRIFKNRQQHDKACQDWLKAEELGIKTLGEETKFCK